MNFITDHVQRAWNRLLFQYRKKEKLKGLIEALVSPLQTLENTLKDIHEDNDINNSKGVNLDRAGRIPGVFNRPTGMGDTKFLRVIKNQIVLNTNEASANEFITTASFFLDSESIYYNETYPAEVEIFSNTVFVPSEQEEIKKQLQSFLPTTVSLGLFGQYDADNPFLFNQPNGFGDVNDPQTGGLLADLY